MTFIQKLFDTSDYPSRWHCGNWGLFEGWLHIVSDLAIFVAYVSIPASLAIVLLYQRKTRLPRVGWMFVAFILACGITHAIDAAIFWWPAYRVSGVMKAVTAAVSLTTAVLVIRMLPGALRLPEMHTQYNTLERTVEEQGRSAKIADAERQSMETRLAELTVRDRRLRQSITAAKACAVRWEVASGTIVWSHGFQEAFRSAGLGRVQDFGSWTDLVGADAARALSASAQTRAARGELLHACYSLSGLESQWHVRLTATPDPEVKGEPRTMIGLFGLVPAADSSVAAHGPAAPSPV